MPPQELQIIVSAINNMGPVIEGISQGIQRLIALQEQSAVASQTNANATAQLLAVQQQALQVMTALGTQLQQVSTKHAEATRSAQQHSQAEREVAAAIAEEDQALREHLRLLEAEVGLRAQQVRYAQATGNSTSAVAHMRQEIDALRATQQGYQQLASTLDTTSVEYVRLQTAVVRAGTEIVQVQQRIDQSMNQTSEYMRKARIEAEQMYAAMGKKVPTLGDQLAGRPLANIDKAAVDTAKQLNVQLQEQVRLLEATATLRKDESTLAATSRNAQTYVSALKAQREALVGLDGGYQSMMSTLSKTSPEYLKAASSSAKVRTEIAGLDETIRKGGGSFEILGMSVEKLGKRIREALVFFVAFRVFWEAWNFVTARMKDLFDLEQQLKRVQSVTIFDPSGMAKLSDLTAVMTSNMARFGTTVKETADAMYELVSAGISFAETQEGLPVVLGLMKAGVSDIGTASRAVSAIHKTWGTDFERIGDVISAVIISSQAEIGGFVTAFQRTAASAKIANLSLEQTAISVAVLNDAMIFGGSAGRGFRQALSQIAQEPDFLAKMGVIVDTSKDMGEQFDSIIMQLGKMQRDGTITVGQLGEQFKRFGVQGQNAIAALAAFAGGYSKLDALLKSGVVQGAQAELVDVRMDNAINQWERLTAAITGTANALVSGKGHLANFLRLYANMFALGVKEGGDLFALQVIVERIREAHRGVAFLQERVKMLSSMDVTSPGVAKALFQSNVELSQQTEQVLIMIKQLEDGYKSLGPEAGKQIEGIVRHWKALYEVQKKVAAAPAAPLAAAKVAPKQYEEIVKEVRAQVALLEAQETLRKSQAKLLETSGRESDFHKSLLQQRDAAIATAAGYDKLLPQLHKGTREWLSLATAAANNKIEIAGLNKELMQFGSQFQMSDRAFVNIADSISLMGDKTRATTVTLTEQTEQAQTFGITMQWLQKPVSILGDEMVKLGDKYDKVGSAAAKSALFLEKQSKATLDATLRAIDLREKMARAAGEFDAGKEAAFDRERIAAFEKRAEFLRTEIALLQLRRSENEQDVAVLERLQTEYDVITDKIMDLNATQGDFWTAFGLGANTALSEMSRGVKETFGEAKALMHDLQKSISDVLFDGITKGLDSATDALKRFGETILRYFTNELSKQVMRSIGGWLKGAMSGGQGATAGTGQGGGLFSMLGNLSSIFGMGGNAASSLQWGAAPAGSSATLGAPMMSGGAGGMSGIMGSVGGMLGSSMMYAAIGKVVGTLIFGKEGGNWASVGAGVGGLAGPWGALAGGVIGGLLGKFFGPTPKGKLKANILPFDLDELTSGGLRDLDTAVKGTRVGALSVNVKGNVYKASKEHKLEEEFARALNDLFIDMVKGIKVLIPQLPKIVGAELDAALEGLSETGLQFEKFSKSGSKAKKKLKKHLENLPNAMIEAVVEELGFGKLDLKMMGGGDAAKGFDGLMNALGGVSLLLKEVNINTDAYAGTLEEFTDKSIGFYESFRKGGETFTETVARVNQGFASLFATIDSLDESILAVTGDIESQVSRRLAMIEDAKTQIVDLVDALTIAVESGADPGEVAAAAQQATDAVNASLQQQIDLVTMLQSRVNTLASAMRASAALLSGLTVAIMELRQATGSTASSSSGGVYRFIGSEASSLQISRSPMDQAMAELRQIFNDTSDLGTKVSVWSSALQLLLSDMDSFTAHLGTMQSGFAEIQRALMAAPPEQALAMAQELIAGIQAGLATGVATIQASYAQQREAIQEATQTRIDGLEAERDAISEATDARIRALEEERDAIQDANSAQLDALNAQVQAANEWASVVQSVRAQLQDIFLMLAPTHPQTSFDTVMADLRSAFSAFQSGPTVELAGKVQELANLAIQTAQTVPGMDLPSLAFRDLTTEITGMLTAIESVGMNQESVEVLTQQIRDIEADQAAQLAEIDMQIEAAREGQEQQLAAIDASIRAAQDSQASQLAALSNAEQAAIQQLQAQALNALEGVRQIVLVKVGELQAQQAIEQARLQAILGDQTYEQYIATKQQEAVILLQGIQDTLRNYLGSLVEGLGFPMPSAATGMAYVPQDGPVYLHQGERVLTAAENRNGGTRGGGSAGSVTINIAVTASGEVNAKRLVDDLEAELSERMQYGRLKEAVRGVKR